MKTKNEECIRTGEWLKQKRKEKGLTQLEVANRFGKTKYWLCDIERGKNGIYFEDMIPLCELYDADINDCYHYVIKGEK